MHVCIYIYIYIYTCVCVCVCVLVYATLWGQGYVPTRRVKPEFFDIVGTNLLIFNKNIKNSKLHLSESVTMQTGFL